MSEGILTTIEIKFSKLEEKFSTLENTFTVLRDQIAREMYIWRALVVFLLIVNISMTALISISTQRQIASDNKERAKNWTMIEDGIERNRVTNLKNYDLIKQNSDSLQRCNACHSHPKGK